MVFGVRGGKMKCHRCGEDKPETLMYYDGKIIGGVIMYGTTHPSSTKTRPLIGAKAKPICKKCFWGR